MTNTTEPVYMVVQLDVKNHETYAQRYAIPVIEQLQKHGVEVLAVSAVPKVLEGSWSGNWTVVLRFPSMAVAESWYGSEEYQPLKSLRIKELTDGGSVILVDAFDPASLGG
jgi:uncharacterized protein (DUF1330 family)